MKSKARFYISIFLEISLVAGLCALIVSETGPRTACRYVYVDAMAQDLIFVLIYVVIAGILVLPTFDFTKNLISRRSSTSSQRITPTMSLAFVLSNFTKTILLFASIYYYFGIIDTSAQENVAETSFSDTLYFSIVTFTTLGYGDFKPCEHIRLFAGLEAFIGTFMLPFASGIIIGSMLQAPDPDQAVSTTSRQDPPTTRPLTHPATRYLPYRFRLRRKRRNSPATADRPGRAPPSE